MSNFYTLTMGRLSVHVLSTDQFRTRHVQIRMITPLTRESATVNALLPYLWMEGTMNHTNSRALMQYTDDLFGAILRTGVTKRGQKHVIEVYASVPEEKGLAHADGLFQKARDLALELFLHPLQNEHGFHKSHVEREKSLHEKRIESIFDDKIAFAMERCTTETCRGDKAGISRMGYVEDLLNLDEKSLSIAHEYLLQNSEIHVYVVGHIEDASSMANQVLEQLTNELGQGTKVQESTVTPLTAMRADPQTIVDHQQITQGKLNLGYRTGLSFAHSEYPALMVMNGILGSFPHSKLFINVREKASLAYYAQSRVDSMTGILAIQTGIEIGNYERAKQIILEQIDAMKLGQITKQELEFTKRGLRNQYLQLIDQPMTMADIHFNGVLTGCYRTLNELLQDVENTTLEEVIHCAEKLQLDTVYFLRDEGVNENA